MNHCWLIEYLKILFSPISPKSLEAGGLDGILFLDIVQYVVDMSAFLQQTFAGFGSKYQDVAGIKTSSVGACAAFDIGA